MNDIFHVADLFTTLSVLAGADDKIPTDRLIDGVDQSALLLEGEEVEQHASEKLVVIVAHWLIRV